MNTKSMKSLLSKKYIIIIIAIVLTILIYNIYLKKEHYTFITNIHERSFNDTIFNMYSQKYKGGVVVATKLTHCDTSLLIEGVNDSLNFWFSSNSDLGFNAWESPTFSILFKNPNTDSFYLKKGSKIIGFVLRK